MSEAGMVIIGAGECGVRAAFSLRESGYAGPVTLISEESALPYERPPLSKGFGTVAKLIAEAEKYVESSVDFLRGVHVKAIDRAARTVTTEDGRTIPYDKLLLATGASPRPFPGLPFDHERVFALRNHDDAERLGRWMEPGRLIAIIGGGFIGLELAATFRKAGAAVTLVEALPRILMRGVPEALALQLQDRHVAEGIDIRCGTPIASVVRLNDGVSITLTDGAEIRSDIVVIGIGAIPNTALAEAAGLAIENGITVDENLRTSDPDIFAAGDCCNFPLPVYDGRRVRLESWRSAQEQGAVAAANMLGQPTPIASVPWFWSDQYDMTLQVAGLADGATTSVARVGADGSTILFHLSGEGRLLAASGIGPGNAVARDIRLAEMLVAARAHPDPAVLADPTSKLKGLLRG